MSRNSYCGIILKRDKVALPMKAKQQQAQGLSWSKITQYWNQQGRRTDKGAEYRGANIAREVRKLKEKTWA